jgi:putative hemolysin
LDYHSTLTNLLGIFLTINTAATAVLGITLLVLCLFSFLLAGAEVAFFSLNSKDINYFKTKENPSFKRIVELLETPKLLLASMLIVNCLVNIGIILISNILVDAFLESTNIVKYFWLTFLIKIVVVTSIILLFCEVLPKVWATHQKIFFAQNSSLFVYLVSTVFGSFSKAIVGLSDGVEKKLKTDDSSLDNSHFDYAIDLLPEEEATKEEKQILKGIRKFSDVTVKQVMKTRLDVSGVEVGITFAQLIQTIEKLHYSRIPVYKNNLDEIVGVLHCKDVLPHIHQPETYNWQPLIRTALFVHEQKLIEDLFEDFKGKRTHFAIVVDEFGGTSGIVTLEDVIEEITGDIKDEFDDEEQPNNKIDDNTFVFEGKTMINDVAKEMNLPSDIFDEIRGDSDSLAGLVLEIAGAFPQTNENVVSGDFTFVPLQIQKNRIEKIKVIITRN